MRKYWAGFKIVFSLYSIIPMPECEWTKENMQYSLCAFPLVGGLVGILVILWRQFAWILGLMGSAVSVVVLMLIPLAVTGGIHLDGLMNTADALGAYKEPKERLEILEDSGAGSFAVIEALAYFFSYFGIYSYLDLQFGDEGDKAWFVIALSFLLSRALSGYAIVTFPQAKNTGLAASFARQADKKAVKNAMIGYMVVIALFMGLTSLAYTAVVYFAAFCVFYWYQYMAKSKFGGITGDLAGWFLQKCELAMAFGVMAAYVLGGMIWY